MWTTEKAMGAMKQYDQAEVYTSETEVHTVYIDDSRISNIETKRESGMMFRMIDGGRMGKASVTLDGENPFERCLGMADSVLGYSPVTEGLNPFPQPRQAIVSRPDVYDEAAANVTPEQLREIAQRVIGSVSDFGDADVKIPRAQIRVSVTRSHTMNSNRVDVEHESTLVYGHFTSMCVRDHPGEGIAFVHGTSLDFDAESVGKDIARKAYDASVCRPFRGRISVPAAFAPSEGSEMIMSSVCDAVDGENVRYGRSRWKDSIGEKVASELLDIVDDPTVPAPLSCVFDDEGTPAERRSIIDGGVLKGFMRDSFCGDSTGNAMRRSSVEPQGAFERTPVIKPLNLTVKPGCMSVEDLVNEFDDVVVIDKFASPECDGLSGSFSLNVRSATVYHRGESLGPINNALLTGNMFDCLRNVCAVCDDSVQTGVINLPTICYGGTELLGN